jgi:hypothetical protein
VWCDDMLCGNYLLGILDGRSMASYPGGLHHVPL